MMMTHVLVFSLVIVRLFLVTVHLYLMMMVLRTHHTTHHTTHHITHHITRHTTRHTPRHTPRTTRHHHRHHHRIIIMEDITTTVVNQMPPIITGLYTLQWLERQQ